MLRCVCLCILSEDGHDLSVAVSCGEVSGEVLRDLLESATPATPSSPRECLEELPISSTADAAELVHALLARRVYTLTSSDFSLS